MVFGYSLQVITKIDCAAPPARKVANKRVAAAKIVKKTADMDAQVKRAAPKKKTTKPTSNVVAQQPSSSKVPPIQPKKAHVTAWKPHALPRSFRSGVVNAVKADKEYEGASDAEEVVTDGELCDKNDDDDDHNDNDNDEDEEEQGGDSEDLEDFIEDDEDALENEEYEEEDKGDEDVEDDLNNLEEQEGILTDKGEDIEEPIKNVPIPPIDDVFTSAPTLQKSRKIKRPRESTPTPEFPTHGSQLPATPATLVADRSPTKHMRTEPPPTPSSTKRATPKKKAGETPATPARQSARKAAAETPSSRMNALSIVDIRTPFSIPESKSPSKNTCKAPKAGTVSVATDNDTVVVSTPVTASTIAPVVTSAAIPAPGVVPPALGPRSLRNPALLVYNSDLNHVQSAALPFACEVLVGITKDPKLEVKGCYKNLPHLRQIETFSNVDTTQVHGLVGFSQLQQWHGANFFSTFLASFLNFSIEECFINLGRVSPLLLKSQSMWGQCYELRNTSEEPLQCLTPIVTISLFLHEMNPRLTWGGHYVQGVPMAYWWDRALAVIRMVTHQPKLEVPSYYNAIQFTTKNKPNDKSADEQMSSTAQTLPKSLFTTAPAVSLKTTPQPKKKATMLAYGKKFPIYDLRTLLKDFPEKTFTKEMLEDRDLYLPLWNEIPYGSLVIMSHMIHIAQPATGGNHFKLFNYAQWGFLLSSPTVD
uniref:Uncharacterized protein n=1 Tax=Psilocybe cubensis TaxID=181762 RepID=A0A8H7XKA7_PSICU